MDVRSASAPASDPVRPVGRGWIVRFGTLFLGMWVAWYGPINILLGLQAAALAPAHKEIVLALVSGSGAAVSLVANPLIGALSDRNVTRYGRRKPWIAAGAVAGAASLVLLAVAPNVSLMVLGWCLVQATVNAVLAAITAVVPDEVPREQRGVIGGVIGVATTLGILGGTGLAVAAPTTTGGFLLCAGVLLVGVVPFLVHGGDPVPPERPRIPKRWTAVLRSFWISPRRHPDFGWAWLTRFLMNLGNAVAVFYLLFYLQDAVGHPDPTAGVLLLTLVYSAGVVCTTVLGGRLSDRTGRRRVFVVVAGLGMSLGLGSLALQTWAAAVAGAVVLGLSYGVYLAVDFALVTEVLPEATDRAKDMGVVAIAQTLPQVVAPVVAAPVVTGLGGYPTLYLLAAAVVALGAVIVTRIRTVR